MAFTLPSRQASVHAGGVSWAVNLDGQTISYSSTANRYAGVRINADGTVDRRGGTSGSYGQIDSGTDWIIPNGAASSDFDVYCTVNSSSGAGLNGGSDAVDTWLDLSTDRMWYCFRNTVGTNSANLTISIRYNGGSTLDSGVYDLTATKNSSPPPVGMGMGFPVLIATA